MKRHTSAHQQGSAHVVLIICLILALITALGWIFYQNFIGKPQAEVDKVYSNIDKKDETKKDDQQTQQPADSSEGGKYLVIKEWAVKVPTSGISSLEYKNKGKYMSFTSAKLRSICANKADMPNNLNVMRGKAGDPVLSETGEGGDIAKYVADNPDALYGKVGSYYYTKPGFRGAYCATSEKDQGAETSAIDAINAALHKIRAL